jgi:hypothetical protein
MLVAQVVDALLGDQRARDYDIGLIFAAKDSPQLVPDGRRRTTKVHGRESNRVLLDNYMFVKHAVNRGMQK